MSRAVAQPAARTDLFVFSQPTNGKEPHENRVPHKIQDRNPRHSFHPKRQGERSRDFVILPIPAKMTSSPSQNISQRYPHRSRSSFDIRGILFLLPWSHGQLRLTLLFCRGELDRDWSGCPTRDRKRCIQIGSTVERVDATSPQTWRNSSRRRRRRTSKTTGRGIPINTFPFSPRGN